MTAPAPARVEYDESPEGSLELAIRESDARFRQFVSEYEGYAEHGGPPVRRLEVPVPKAVLILGTGSPIRVASSGRADELEDGHGGFLAGLTDVPALVESDGSQAGVQVNLTPLGARQILGMPMHEITGRVFHLGELLGHEGEALIEQLREEPDWDERFRLVDAFLERRLAANDPPPRPVSWAWGQVRLSHGNVNIGWLADQVGWSHKHFIERFRDAIGLPPRLAARIVRFERAWQMAYRPGKPDWAAIAAECGYYDQAHLVREFRAFARCTPNEFRARRLAEGGTNGMNLPEG